MFKNPSGRIFDIIDYPSMGPNEIVRRLPEGGNGNFRIGSQVRVYEGQAAVFFRDGKALDTFGPGQHTITTANVPVLIDFIGKLFNDRSPFAADVVYVNTREFPDMGWGTSQPILVRNPGMGLGVALLKAHGTYAFQVSNPQQFVSQVVGAAGAFKTEQIQSRFRSILLSKLQDLIAELATKGGKSVPELIALTDEISAGLLAKAQEDFKAVGITLKQVYAQSITPDERGAEQLRAMGMLDMATYTQLQAADAMRDAAKNPSGGAGLTAGIGAGMGIGQVLGGALQQGMMNTAGAAPVATGAAAAGAAAGAAAAAPTPDVMSPAQAATYLQVTEADVMQMITGGQLKAKQIGSQYRISKSALDDFLKS
ncbi:MAG: SPFH domain-containing protein [Anaerolineales bacterium]|nr:SPFH domain-containing protein [Anaerolineales bacterium]